MKQLTFVMLSAILAIAFLFVGIKGNNIDQHQIPPKPASSGSYITLQDGSEHFIDTSGDFCTNKLFNYGFFTFIDPSGERRSFPSNQITEIHLFDLPQITTAPDNYFWFLCYGMTNLKVACIHFPNLTSVGDNFCYGMFSYCSSLTSLSVFFDFPKNITSVGRFFCYEMFSFCSNLRNDSANKVNIHVPNVSGNNFCGEMFLKCSNLKNVPSTPKPNVDIGINSI